MKHLCKKANLKKLMWYTIYTLPLIIYIIASINNANNIQLINILNSMGISNNNIIYNTIYNIFGNGGILELFSNSTIFAYLTYYIGMKILHITTDSILLLPEIVHNWLDKINSDKKEDF